MINYILLAISVSIDSLGIGITYGIKSTKLFLISKVILFAISIFITSLAVFIGDLICDILPNSFANYIGTTILIFLGLWIIYQNFKGDNIESNMKTQSLGSSKTISFSIFNTTIQIIRNPMSSDLDGSKKIDCKESLYLGLALSLDSIGVGIGGSIVGINTIMFPLLVASFQLIFLSLGNFLGKKIISSVHFPKNIWSIISGFLLICIGVFKLL